MATELYRIQNVFDGHTVFNSTEKVTSIDGTSEILFIGTSQGRVLFLDLSTGNILRSVQLPKNGLVTQLLAVTANDYLITLSASTMININIESYELSNLNISWSITYVGINKNPVITDPFVLQLALATSNRYVLVCENRMNNLEIKQKIRMEDNVVTLSYNKYCICYALSNAYFVHNILENKTLSLFPYDSRIVRPIIIQADVDEFLLNGTEGLGVFATLDGVSSRPPVFWGKTPIISFTYRSPYILVLTASSITIYSCEQSTALQRLPFSGGALLDCINGQLYVCSNKSITYLEEISWLDRVEAIANSGELDDALKLAENSILSLQHNEAAIVKYNNLRQKLALAFFKRGDFEKFHELAITSELDPREVLNLFEFLLPFPSGFQSMLISENPFEYCYTTESVDNLTYLELYLREVRQLHWTIEFRRDIDALLLRLMALRKDALDADDMTLNLFCGFNDCNVWMRDHKRRKFLLHIAFCVGDYDNALAISRELYDDNLWDDDIFRICLQSFSRFYKEQTIIAWIEFLIEIQHGSVIECLKNCSVELNHSKVIRILQKNRGLLMSYLEEMKELENAEFHSLLFSMYVEEINMLMAEGDSAENKLKLFRKKLRNLLLQPNKLDLMQTRAVLKSYRFFSVELSLLDSVEEKGCVRCVEKLLNEHKDYDAAELCCIYTDTPDHALKLVLLKFYLKNITYQQKFRDRVISLLSMSCFTSDEIEVLGSFPTDWSLSSIFSFVKGSVICAEERFHCQQLKKAAVTKALEAFSRKVSKTAFLQVQINDKTICASCGIFVGNEDAACYPNSSQVFHRRCLSI
ncbi:unnamed protein product [Thelazia callipaeda]|uniref:CNH domain-containing protein n=1 Tax=Thelazia callipaeda TaxID=103827 RepID=A0A0N5CV38_THECL|nr:unnamed protein product [Thelazia callipaeda]